MTDREKAQASITLANMSGHPEIALGFRLITDTFRPGLLPNDSSSSPELPVYTGQIVSQEDNLALPSPYYTPDYVTSERQTLLDYLENWH
jgi:hypothetical protein